MYKIDWDKYLSEERFRQSKDKLNSWDKRNAFESDFGRVCFSSASRRMHDKTQVIPLSSGDSVHTRLTHSIEVMNIAYSLAINYCRSNDFKALYGDKAVDYIRAISAIVRAASFVHDIGNPPFGHFGEQVIQDFFVNYFNENKDVKQQIARDTRPFGNGINDFICFDGNAEGFRALTRLNYMGNLAGLNLTYATLAAYCKYPNLGAAHADGYIGNKKHGVFVSESDVFNNMIDACNMRMPNGKIKRHPLCFLVEAADSICYSVMDIEDGFYQKWYSITTITDFITDFIKEKTSSKFIHNMIKEKIADKIKDHNAEWQAGSEVLDRQLMMDLRVGLIDYFVRLAGKNFIDHLQEIDEGSYSNELIDDGKDGVFAALQKFSQKYIFPRKEILQVEMTGHSVISGLLKNYIFFATHHDDKYRKKLNSLLSSSNIYTAIHEKKHSKEKYWYGTNQERTEFDFADYDMYTTLGTIVDQVAGMTDKYAVSLFQKLSGQRL